MARVLAPNVVNALCWDWPRILLINLVGSRYSAARVEWKITPAMLPPRAATAILMFDQQFSISVAAGGVAEQPTAEQVDRRREVEFALVGRGFRSYRRPTSHSALAR